MQELERLLVRGQGGGPLRGGRRRLRGLLELAGRLVVRRPVAVAAELGTAPGHLRDPGVQRAAPGQRRVGLDGVADQRVPEAEPPRRLRLHEPPLDQLVEVPGRLLLGAARHGGHEVHVEAAVHDGGGDRAVPGRLRERVEPLPDRVGQRLRHERRVRGEVPLRGGVHELLDVQGHAARPLVHQLDQPPRRARAGQQLAHHAPGLDEVQTGERDLLGHPLEQEPGPPGPHRRVVVQLVGPQRPDDEQRQGRQPAGQVGDDLQAQLVAPVQVLQRQQRRAAGRRARPAGPPTSRTSSRRRRCASPAYADSSGTCSRSATSCRPNADRSALLGAGQPVAEVEQQAGRELDVLGRGGRGPQREPAGRRPLAELVQQPGLADARLAGQEQQLATAGARGVQAALGQQEQLVPAVHRAGADVPGHPRPSHRCRCGARSPCRAFDR